MLASAVFIVIDLIALILTALYFFIKKAVVAGTEEALMAYDKKNGRIPETMIDIGAEALKVQRAQALEEKRQMRLAKKEAKKEGKKK